jgi:hypothetical protein
MAEEQEGVMGRFSFSNIVYLGLGLVLLSGALASQGNGGGRQARPVVRPSGPGPLPVPMARQKKVPKSPRRGVQEELSYGPSFRRRPADPATWRASQPVETEVEDPGHASAPLVRRVWVKRYRDVQGLQDWPNDLVVSADGTAYVTGFSWDSVTGLDAATVKYSPNGTEQWRRRYHGGPGSQDRGNALAVDRAGNVYVAGQAGVTGEFRDYLLLKYSPGGQRLWVRRFSSPELGGYGHSMALAIIVDEFDDVYVSGRSAAPEGVASGFDMVTLKLDSDGNEVWRNRYGGLPRGSWGEELTSMVLDPFGDLVLGGWGPTPNREESWVVAKIDAEGRLLWHRHQRGAAGGRARVEDLTVDAEGNIYVTGYRDRPRGDSDILTIKYSPLGASQWHARHDGPAHDGDIGSAIAVDAEGQVFVTGNVWTGSPLDGGDSSDVVTLKYDDRGSLQWSQTVDGPSSGGDHGFDVVAAGDGGAYVCGFERRLGRGDFLTLRYSSSGALLWKAVYEGPGHEGDAARYMALDESGDIYVTGSSEGRLGSDYATVKYTEN